MNDSIIKRLRIAAIVRETADAKTFVLEPLDGWQPAYKPGQFITFVFSTKEGEARRSFSISSANDEPLAVTVKKVDNGEFSRRMIYKTAVGDMLRSSGTGGFFTLPEKEDFETVFFLAAGSGITPCFALMKTLLYATSKSVILVYSNRSEADTIFFDSLKSLQERFRSRFSIRFLFSNRNNVLESRLSHWLLTHLLEEYLPEERQKTLFYTCGPPDYMIMTGISLRSNGIPAAHIIKEDFSQARRLTHPRPPDTGLHQVTIYINENTYTFPVRYPKSIIAAAKALNIQLPYSCEAGRCGSCAATCISGKIWMAYNEVLVDEEVAQGRILTCQSYPVGGDVVIRF